MSMQIKMHSDINHEWAEVPMMVLVQLGIVDKISRYSYHDTYGQVAYLEGDCDMLHLTDALREHGVEWHLKPERMVDGDSPIRQLPRFN
jgi:hypothetical protein